MKKKILVLAVIAICLAGFATGTLAYFTYDDQVHNVITTDAVKIEVKEWQKTEEGLVEYPHAPIPVMPGTTVSKIPEIYNLGAESWIRARIDVEIRDVENNVMPHTAEELANIITIAVDAEKWTEKDGWWYCDQPVKDKTAPLFEQVVFNGPNMTNGYQNCTVTVTVSAQAVQTANNGRTVLEAKGWGDNT